MRQISLWTTALSIALMTVAPAHADDETLRKELDALRVQVVALQHEVDQMRGAPMAAGVQATPAPAPAPSSNVPSQRT
ncbi:MAG TPA: hypothetical protein VGO25_00845, partial [Rhodanobacteraceae bacterium]|nr:hypothetical protein [Rhodanobacteraceae bacterium]